MVLRDQWMTAIVRYSSRIFRRKQALLTVRGLAFVGGIFLLLVDEMLLWILAIPLLAVTPAKDLVLESPTFRIRRVLTVSILIVLTTIWFAKGILVISKEIIFASGSPFTVRIVRSADVKTPEQSAAPSSLPLSIAPPRVVSVKSTYRTLENIRGSAPPGILVRVFIEEQGSHRALEYTVPSSAEGVWNLVLRTSDGELLRLPAATYSVTAVSEDGSVGVYSIPSQVFVWTSRMSPSDWLLAQGSLALNALVIILVGGAVLITFLTIS